MCSEVEILDAAFSAREYPLEIIPPLGNCRKVLFSTKVTWFVLLEFVANRLPPDVAVLRHYGPIPERQKRLAESIIDQFEAPVFFVGDLDPTDLVTYATLVSGNAVGSRLSQTSYLGVGDEWLALCEGDRAALSLSECCIPLDVDERRALDRVMKQPILELLASGKKLEIEGASGVSQNS